MVCFIKTWSYCQHKGSSRNSSASQRNSQSEGGQNLCLVLFETVKLLLLLRHHPWWVSGWVEIRCTMRSVSLCIWIKGRQPGSGRQPPPPPRSYCNTMVSIWSGFGEYFSGWCEQQLTYLDWVNAWCQLKSGSRNTSLHWCRWGLLKPYSSTTT